MAACATEAPLHHLQLLQQEHYCAVACSPTNFISKNNQMELQSGRWQNYSVLAELLQLKYRFLLTRFLVIILHILLVLDEELMTELIIKLAPQSSK